MGDATTAKAERKAKDQGNRIIQLLQSSREAGVEVFHFALFPEGEAMQRFNQTHPDACVTSITSAAAWATGSAKVILQDFNRLLHPDDQDSLHQYIENHLKPAAAGLKTDEIQRFSSNRFRIRRDDGLWHWYEIRSRLFLHSTGVTVVEGVFTDVSALMALLLQDPLTGLDNRLANEQRLQAAMAKQEGYPLAVINLDLDNFRRLNNCLGQARGDQAIKDTAALLRTLVPRQHWLSRPGADEFLIVLEGGEARAGEQACATLIDEAIRLSRRLQEVLGRTVPLRAGASSRFTACCGIAIHQPGDGGDCQVLLQQASSALSEAKRMGPGSLCLFSEKLQAAMQHRINLERDLDQALRENALALHFQPKVNRQGQWIGAEVLLRWPQAHGRMISPEEFIPVAEQTGQIHDIGLWVLEQTCAQLGRWTRQGLKPPPLAINISSVQLESAANDQQPLLQTVQRLCREHGITCRQLSFELTETALLSDWQGAREQLNHLAAAGIELAIDDFGTGYSSLRLLQSLPVKLIKLDKVFVQNLPASNADCRLVTGTLEIARQLGLETLAEGVETEAQWQCLQSLGCESYQGYLFSRPLSAADFARQWSQHNALDMLN